MQPDCPRLSTAPLRRGHLDIWVHLEDAARSQMSTWGSSGVAGIWSSIWTHLEPHLEPHLELYN